jgi:fibronectin type 3 domain-containing protein
MKNKGKLFYFCLFAAVLFLPFTSCLLIDDPEDESGNGGITVTVSPSSVTLAKGTTQKFEATVTGSYSSSVTWSVEGSSSSTTTIDRDGLLAVAANESSRTLTVKAIWSSYGGDTANGTAAVTVATDAEIPSNLKISKPEKTGIPLSWSAVTNASSYKVYRSINGKDYSHLGNTSSVSYSDTAITAGSSYYYAVSAVVNSLETGKSSVVFSFAEEYFALPVFSDRRLVPITAGQKHYYRFPVTSGESYTVTWEDGKSKNADSNIRVSVWQNDGTAAFTDIGYYRGGYTDPLVFTAAMAGYISVEVKNANNSNRFNYMAYCLRKNDESDAGVAALPPAMVTGIKVTSPATSSVTLSWDAISDAANYNIYRSPTQIATPGLVGNSNSTSFADTNVASGASYYYTIAPVNAGGKEGVWVQGAFAYAASHFPLLEYSASDLMELSAGSKHYYRLAVSSGQGITITWQNGSSQNANSNIRVSVWQNDGTAAFTDIGYYRGGYTDPLVFTAAMAGYVTVEVKNVNNSTNYNYQIYR